MTYDDDKGGVITATCPYGYGDWYGSKNVTFISSYDSNYHVLPSITLLNLTMQCVDRWREMVYYAVNVKMVSVP